jgi:chromosome segregation ATPase
VKFLLWQFSVYALAAFVLGLAVAYLWSRPQVARLTRKLNSQQAHIGALQSEIVDLQTVVRRDQNIVAAMAPLTEQLSAARSALTLVEAELEASALHHAMLTNKTVDLSQRAARNETLAGETERAQGEALRIRVALDSAIAEHTAGRALSEQTLADALARAQSAESSLANLRRAHERLVVDSRRELTELTVRTERAERERLASPASAASPALSAAGTGATAASVWQSAMVEAVNAPTDDQILIVLPNERELVSGEIPVTGSALAKEFTDEINVESSRESDRLGTTTLLEADQTSPGLVIELRSSE